MSLTALLKEKNKILSTSSLLGIIGFLTLFYQLEPPPSDIFVFLSIILYGLYLVLKKEKPPLTYIDKIVLAFLIFNFFQLLFFRNNQAIFWVSVTTFLILSFEVIKNLAKIFSIKSFFIAYLISAFVNLSLMAIGFFSFYSLKIFEPLLIEFGRARGLFKDPNVAGPFLIPAFIFFVEESVQRPKWWKFMASGALLTGIYLSFSRGALIAAAVSFLIWLFLRRRDLIIKWKLYGAVVLNLIIFSILVFSYGPFATLAHDRFKLVQGYDTQDRAASWQSGLIGFTQNPAGSGPGSFESGALDSAKQEITQKIGSLNIPQSQKNELIQQLNSGNTALVASKAGVTITPSAHDTYLRVLRENGVIGIIIFAAFILGILWKSRILLKFVNPQDTYAIVLFASWVGVLANSVVVDTLHWRLFWYLPALLLVALEQRVGKN